MIKSVKLMFGNKRNFHRNNYCGTGSFLLNMIHMTQFGGEGVLCVCLRERKNINTMHVCMFMCFLPSACASVCMCVSFFFTVFVTSQCDVGIYQHDSLVFCFRDHGTVSAK